VNLGYWGYRILSGVVGVLPAAMMRALGAGVGTLLWLIPSRRKQLARRHLQRAVGVPPSRSQVRRMFASYGRYYAEVFWTRPRRLKSLLANSTIEGQEWLVAGKAAGKGVIVALPHLGNWEAAGLEAVRQGVPVTAVAEVLSDPRIVEWFTHRRAMFGIEIALASKGVSSLIETRLRQGGTVALVADRDLKRKGVPVTFFGERTTLPAGPFLLAMRTGAMLLPAGTYFTEQGHHNVVLPPLEIPPEGDNPARLAAAAQLLANRFEELIRKAPTDWHIFQPNWPSDFDQS